MGMGGGGGTPVVDEIVIQPGPMKSPMRIAPSGASKFLVTDYQGGIVYEVNTASPDQPSPLFQIAGHPLAIEVVSGGNATFRDVLPLLTPRDRRIIQDILFNPRPRSINEIARDFRVSVLQVRSIVEQTLRQLRQPQVKIFVGNDSGGTIDVYRLDGRKLSTFTSAGGIRPSDMVCDQARQQLFVVDGLAHDIKIFSASGNLIGTFGEAAPLSDPKGIAIDAGAKQVYVSDYGDPRVGIPPSINIFDFEGKLIRRIIGNLSRPQGLALDERNLYVVDAMLGQILVFDRVSYAYTGAIGSFGVADGQLLLPMDLSRDTATGKLYVTNNRVGRVAAFSPPAP